MGEVTDTSAAADPVARVLAYHERTKHHLHRYARSPGYMDWATQPDPFRTYAGAERIELPLAADDVETTYDALYGGGVEARPLGLEALGAFLELALGLTAWKEYGGNRWALRSDPSSGNLHPTEGYVVLPEVAGPAAGVFHYLSRDHVLERRCRLHPERARDVFRRLPAGAFLVGISSIHWREAWKYGERAFRYCQHDAGHVIATVRFAAAALGWSAWLVDGLGDEATARLLGLDRAADFADVAAPDREHPDGVLVVAPRGAAPPALLPLDELVENAAWTGSANPLSVAHAAWDVIEDVAAATFEPASAIRFSGSSTGLSTGPSSGLPPLPPCCELPATTIIRRRRSAVALDGRTSLPARRFYRMLDAVLPRPGVAPFDALPWEPRIHLGIFVHRVEGLAPGLYVFERTDAVHAALEELLGPDARWARPAGCPDHLHLFCLAESDLRHAAKTVSCHQDIAADGAFSLGMVSEFRAPILAGACAYRRLFWEAGVLGQVLYLEAEAAGVRATGIGCYFDDAFHQLLGMEGDRFQSLYHFTVGGPVADARLVTHPPYAHLRRGRGGDEA